MCVFGDIHNIFCRRRPTICLGYMLTLYSLVYTYRDVERKRENFIFTQAAKYFFWNFKYSVKWSSLSIVSYGDII